VLGTAPRFAIEAASPFGWQRYVADQQRIIAIDRFGFSGPGPLVYEELGLTPAKIAQRVAEAL
jgi:transketolase